MFVKNGASTFVRRRTKHLMDCQLNKQHTRLRDGATSRVLRSQLVYKSASNVKGLVTISGVIVALRFIAGTVIPYTALFLDDMIDRQRV